MGLTDINSYRIREILLSAFCFVPYANTETLALAFLHRTHTGQRRVTVRAIDEENAEISADATEIDLQDPESTGLVPIAPSKGGPGGIVVYGGEQLIFYELRDADDKRESPKRRRTSTSSRKPDAAILWPYSSIVG
jgi:hypothetical protein